MAETGLPRVLVVNDDQRLGQSVCRLLNELNYETRLALDGQQGLEVMASWRPDLILLDIIMPVLDGWGFLRELANLPANDRPTVVVWSVLDSDELARARVLGAAECLQRATTGPDELLAAIARALRGAQSN